jgi:hypothetical protein
MKNRKQKLVQAVKTATKKRGEKRSARRSRNTARVADLKKMRLKIDEFAKTHPAFNKIADDVEFWLKQKLNLDEAYYLADMLDKLKTKLGARHE